MSRLIYVRPEQRHFDYPDDVERIVEAARSMGHGMSANDAYEAWGDYSGSMAAGWMTLPKTNAEILECIEPYVARVDG